MLQGSLKLFWAHKLILENGKECKVPQDLPKASSNITCTLTLIVKATNYLIRYNHQYGHCAIPCNHGYLYYHILYRIIRYSTVRYSTVRHSTVLYGIIPYCIIQYQHSTGTIPYCSVIGTAHYRYSMTTLLM